MTESSTEAIRRDLGCAGKSPQSCSARVTIRWNDCEHCKVLTRHLRTSRNEILVTGTFILHSETNQVKTLNLLISFVLPMDLTGKILSHSKSDAHETKCNTILLFSTLFLPSFCYYTFVGNSVNTGNHQENRFCGGTRGAGPTPPSGFPQPPQTLPS